MAEGLQGAVHVLHGAFTEKNFDKLETVSHSTLLRCEPYLLGHHLFILSRRTVLQTEHG